MNRLGLVMLLLVCEVLKGNDECGVETERCSHPDDLAVAVRLSAPSCVAGCATELKVIASGLVEGVTYRMLVEVWRGSDLIHADEISVAWSREIAEKAAPSSSHLFQHMLPSLSVGPNTVRATLLDANVDEADEAALASVVHRIHATEGVYMHPSATTEDVLFKQSQNVNVDNGPALGRYQGFDLDDKYMAVEQPHKHVNGSRHETGCLITSPSQGSMMVLTEDFDLLDVLFTASCRVEQAACALSVCFIELWIGGEKILSRECGLADTWEEKDSNTRVVRVSAGLGNLDPQVYDFNMHIFCNDYNMRNTSCAVAMYPDVRPAECVPKFVIPDESHIFKMQEGEQECTAEMSFGQMLKVCEGSGNRFRAHYFLRNFPPRPAGTLSGHYFSEISRQHQSA